MDEVIGLPIKNQMYEVYIDADNILDESVIHYIFLYPPYSEINGWDDIDNEIESTKIVACKLKLIESYPFSNAHANQLISRNIVPKRAKKYQANIMSISPFLSFCQCYSGDDNFYLYRIQDKDQSFMCWEKSRSYQKINFSEDLIYLSGSASEQQFATLIEIKDNKYFIKFHEYHNPATDEIVVINYQLQGDELRFFKRILQV